MDSNATLPPAPGVAFEGFLKKGEFRLQVCQGCGRQIYYPRSLCPFCGGTDLEWRLVSGEGSVYSTTTVRQRPERGGNYNISIVDLREGARMLSRVEGIESTAVKIGMPVRAAIIEEKGQPLIIFQAKNET